MIMPFAYFDICYFFLDLCYFDQSQIQLIFKFNFYLKTCVPLYGFKQLT